MIIRILSSRLRGVGRRYFFWKISAKIRINEPSDQRTFGTMNLRNKKTSEQRHGTVSVIIKPYIYGHCFSDNKASHSWILFSVAFI